MENKRAYAQAKANEVGARVNSMKSSADQKKATVEARTNHGAGLAGKAKILSNKPQPKRK